MAETNAGLFSRVAEDRRGYDPEEVDRFMDRARGIYDDGGLIPLAEIRGLRFATAPGGYSRREVDTAMERLIDAFALAERDQFIDAHGEDAWYAELAARAEPLRRRLERAENHRFREPTNSAALGYRKSVVDELCHELEAYLDGANPMSVDEVRRIRFSGAHGSDGYDEAQVDAFLARMTEIMAAVG